MNTQDNNEYTKLRYNMSKIGNKIARKPKKKPWGL